jgi:hypothetical protein
MSVSILINSSDYGVTSTPLSLLDAKTKRLVQINYFYKDYYTALNEIIIVLIKTFILMMIVLYVYSVFHMFRIPVFILYSIIGVIGLLYAFKMFIEISDRNNQDFNMYEFQFQKDSAPPLNSTGGSEITSNIPKLYTCIDSECCSDNQMFDLKLGKCTQILQSKNKGEKNKREKNKK